jgi:hypothetical protein
MVRVPDDYARNESMRTFLLAFESLMPTREKKEEERAAATDEMGETAADGADIVELTNPRWEHVDDARKEKSPDAASGGDRVSLAVDVKGIPEGAEVVFDIYDTSQSPPQRVATVRGANEGGVARATWDLGDSGGPVKSVVLRLPAGTSEEKSSFTLRGKSGEKTLDLSGAAVRGDIAELQFDGLDPSDVYGLEFGQSDGGDATSLSDKISSAATVPDMGKLAFEAHARSKNTEQREIALEGGGITSLKLSVPVNQGDAGSFTLSDSTEEYSVTTDLPTGGETAEILFDGLDPSRRFTLSAECGGNEPCDLFSDQPLSEVRSV